MNLAVRASPRKLKVVLMSLIAAIAVTIIAINAHHAGSGTASANFTSSNIKAES